jgi:hypothetical protein
MGDGKPPQMLPFVAENGETDMSSQFYQTTARR